MAINVLKSRSTLLSISAILLRARWIRHWGEKPRCAVRIGSINCEELFTTDRHFQNAGPPLLKMISSPGDYSMAQTDLYCPAQQIHDRMLSEYSFCFILREPGGVAFWAVFNSSVLVQHINALDFLFLKYKETLDNQSRDEGELWRSIRKSNGTHQSGFFLGNAVHLLNLLLHRAQSLLHCL